MYSNGYNIYKSNSVNYASKDQLLIMLVDGAVNFSKRALKAFEDQNIIEIHNNLVKVQDIFTELMVTIDRNAGEWAENMYKIYDFIKQKLFEANIKKDVKCLEEVMPLIGEVRAIWKEAYKVSKTQQ